MLKKKNSLSYLMGPEKRAPDWRRAKKGLGAKALRRRAG
jgi:hypothetical protein